MEAATAYAWEGVEKDVSEWLCSSNKAFSIQLCACQKPLRDPRLTPCNDLCRPITAGRADRGGRRGGRRRALSSDFYVSHFR